MRQKGTDTTNWLTNSDPIAIATELSRFEPEKRAEIFQRLPAELKTTWKPAAALAREWDLKQLSARLEAAGD